MLTLLFIPEHVIAMIERNAVCIVDLDERKVRKQYVHPPDLGEEEFSALAWTRFYDRRSTVVLAVGGDYFLVIMFADSFSNIRRAKGRKAD